MKGNTSPYQENNEIQALICFLNAIYNVIVPFQVTGYRDAEYLRAVSGRKLVSVYHERGEIMRVLLLVDNHPLVLVGIYLHPLSPSLVLHGSNSMLHITQGAARYGLGDCRVVHVLPHESANLKIIDHEQKKPKAKLGALWNSGGDWAPLREAFCGQLDALVSVCQKVSHPGFDAVRHVEAINLSDKDLMIDKVKGLAIIK